MGIFDIKPARKQEKVVDENKPIEERIVDAIREVYDPEIPVNIYEMGLIYKVDHQPGSDQVDVEMTLTSPNCPAAQDLPIDVQNAVLSLPEIEKVNVEIVWEPTWTPEMMTESAKLELGMI